jgi:hypothetical protein
LRWRWCLQAPGAPRFRFNRPPHAAVLFIDFIFSPEGQKILERFDYGSAVKDYGSKRWYIERGMTPDQLEKKVPVGRRRFASSRENEVTSSQMAVARVIVEDQLNKLAIDFLTGNWQRCSCDLLLRLT